MCGDLPRTTLRAAGVGLTAIAGMWLWIVLGSLVGAESDQHELLLRLLPAKTHAEPAPGAGRQTCQGRSSRVEETHETGWGIV